MNDNELFVSVEQVKKWFTNSYGRCPGFEGLRSIAIKNECYKNLQQGEKSDREEIKKETIKLTYFPYIR